MPRGYLLVFWVISAVCLFVLGFYMRWSDFTWTIVVDSANHHPQTLYRYNGTSEKWIVVTTKSPDITSSIEVLTKIPGWRVVVVGDTHIPGNWSAHDCIYLDIYEQRRIGFEIIPHMPDSSSLKKNIGYLFAVANGARIIYETDDGNRPLYLLNNFIYSNTTRGLLYDGKHFFNPYRHFGQPNLWPRGYPPEVNNKSWTKNYCLSNWRTPLIQQGLVNGDPDVAVTFRQAWKKAHHSWNVAFDKETPPVIVPIRVFSPFNSQNTVFLYDALWAMMLPSTTTSMHDIWRAYWAQRLLWETGGNLGFFPPNVFRMNNSSTSSLYTDGEENTITRIKTLITFLKEWRCAPEKSFFSCVLGLSTDMARQRFWENKDAVLTAAWIKDLRKLGYREPTRIPFGSLHNKSIFIPEIFLPKQTRKIKQMINVDFWPTMQTSPLQNSIDRETEILLSTVISMRSFCKNVTQNLGKFNLTKRLVSYPNILLIIVFNFPHYQNLPFLETMYRFRFPHIVICGAQRSKYEEYVGLLLQPLTFIEVAIGNGWFGQHCLIEAMKMNYNVDGYLYIGDDTLINPWSIVKQPIDKLWFYNNILLRQSGQTKWIWFNNKHVGLKTYQTAINVSRTLDRTRFDHFFKRLARNTNASDGFLHGGADIAYVPRKHKDDVLYFMDHFSRYNLFLEMAFPTVFAGIEAYHRLPGMYLWYDGKREHIEKYFNKSAVFLHPVKLSLEYAKPKGKIFFCDTYFPLAITDD